MSRIYFNSRETIVWLGEGPNIYADLEAEQLLRRLYNVCDAGYGSWLQAFFHNGDGSACAIRPGLTCPCGVPFLGLPDYADEPATYSYDRPLARLLQSSVDLQHRLIQLLAVVNTFFARRYWSRRWVLQEMENTFRGQFCWGPCSVDKKISDIVLPMVRDIVIVLKQAIELLGIDLFGPSRVFGSILERIDKVLGVSNAMSTSSLEQALARCSSFDCFDPRDRLYALFGIFQIADLPGSDHGDALHGMTPDYSLSAADAYTVYARHLIRKEILGAIFSNLYHPPSSSDPVVRDSPSWVPDLRREFVLPSGRCSPRTCSMPDDARSIFLPVYFLGTIGEDLIQSRKTFSLRDSAIATCGSVGTTIDSPSQEGTRQGPSFHLEGMHPALMAEGDLICAFEEEYDTTKDVNDALLVIREVEKATICRKSQQVADTYVITHNIFAGSLSRVDGIPLKWKSPKNSMRWIRVI